MLVAVCLTAFCVNVRGEETGDLREAVARLEKAVMELSARVAALETKPQPKAEPPAPPEGPDEAAAQRVLADMVRQQSQGAIDLISFRKTDGLLHTLLSVKKYEMSFEAEIRVNATGIWLFHPAYENEYGFRLAQVPRKMDPLQAQYFYASNPGIQVNRGAGFRLTGKLHFERAENGWRLTQVESARFDMLR